ncbi:hypothetical protein EIP91_001084 [Steccherinum ochraceum]|uniref:Uncharacterized protein n=1 Tax=Steccherinum ochraceum TaxID=92696 RepID=A0A4R0RH31_9APHY|nr:hypothetical protein EIP91_001084 [Steccherinum ochraceum]
MPDPNLVLATRSVAGGQSVLARTRSKLKELVLHHRSRSSTSPQPSVPADNAGQSDVASTTGTTRSEDVEEPQIVMTMWEEYGQKYGDFNEFIAYHVISYLLYAAKENKYDRVILREVDVSEVFLQRLMNSGHKVCRSTVLFKAIVEFYHSEGVEKPATVCLDVGYDPMVSLLYSFPNRLMTYRIDLKPQEEVENMPSFVLESSLASDSDSVYSNVSSLEL